jgi:TOBE domain-containing protein
MTRNSGVREGATPEHHNTGFYNVRLTDAVIESVITRRSADEMGLQNGERITVRGEGDRVMLSK